MYKDDYDLNELSLKVHGLSTEGMLAVLLEMISELKEKVETIEKQTYKKPVGRPRGSFKSPEGPSKGYTPVQESMPEAIPEVTNGVHTEIRDDQ